MYLVTAKQMQAMDRETIQEFGIPGRVLMENAGRGAFDFLKELFPDLESKRAAVLAGPGNNGGDGFVVARYLMQMGVRTDVFLFAPRERIAGDSLSNLKLLETLVKVCPQGSLTEISDMESLNRIDDNLARADLMVDALLGTGLTSDVRGVLKTAIDRVNALACKVLSIDIPSGLNADTGCVQGTAIKAFATATFAFAKAGHFLFPGKTLTGRLRIVDIGIPPFVRKKFNPGLRVVQHREVARLFPPREPDAHKGNFGHLLVVAGSTGKTGAAALTANGAMAMGAGLVTVGIPASLNPIMEIKVTEAMTFPLEESVKGHLSDTCFDTLKTLAQQKSAMAIGPGLGTDRATQALVRRVIAELTIPLVIDADGLNALADDPDILKKARSPIILTPHPGEMARLCQTTTEKIQASRLEWAADFAGKFNLIVVLKGAPTLLALPDGRTCLCPTGNPGMATAGMGDVLTGMIAALAARGFPLEKAALAGVFLHGLAGDILAHQYGGPGFTASDMICAIPAAVNGEPPWN